MTTLAEEALRQLDDLLTDHDEREAKGIAATELTTRMAAAVERFAPAGSIYHARAARALAHARDLLQALWEISAVVRALRTDYERGNLLTVEQAVRQDVFEDFLEMAEHIAANIMAAPAAVLAGSVLEDHVRKLAVANEIDVTDEKGRPRRFEQLTIELRGHEREGISEAQRKQLAAWYAVRTDAAHGHFDNVVDDDVARMIDAIRDFMVRHPAVAREDASACEPHARALSGTPLGKAVEGALKRLLPSVVNRLNPPFSDDMPQDKLERKAPGRNVELRKRLARRRLAQLPIQMQMAQGVGVARGPLSVVLPTHDPRLAIVWVRLEAIAVEVRVDLGTVDCDPLTDKEKERAAM